MWSSFRSKVPLISIPYKVLEDIEKALELKDGSVFYDLGCGNGRILFYLAHKYPNVKFIGIENAKFPILIANIISWLNKKINNIDVKIIKRSFFDVDLSRATHIFTYLYPDIMNDLLPKLKKELKPKTRLVSVSFYFKDKKEIKEINLKRNKYQLAQKIYIYEF